MIKKWLKSLLQSCLVFLAKLTIWRFKPIVIAVTGSAGKTSSKEAIWAALKNFFIIRRSVGNFNNELGVPLSILGDYFEIKRPVWFFWLIVFFKGLFQLLKSSSSKYPQILVLEYASDKPGDISYLLKIAKPHIGVISAVGKIPVHVEFYPEGVEQVTREKSKIVSCLGAKNFAVLNFDDFLVMNLSKKTRARVIGFGFSSKADVRIVNFHHVIVAKRIDGIAFKLDYAGSLIPVFIKNVFSVSHAYVTACAVAVACVVFDKNIAEVVDSFLSNYVPARGRSNIVLGINGSQIIDESYNSSPIAVELVLNTLCQISSFRKIAVLGDMMELGEYTIEAHELIGKIVPRSVDVLITVGPRAKLIAQKANKEMSDENVFSFDNFQEAVLLLKRLIKPGDLILVKGSRVMNLDKLVEEIKAKTSN